MSVDKVCCMSSSLMYRTVIDQAKTFVKGITPNFAKMGFQRTSVRDSIELLDTPETFVKAAT